MKRKICVVTGSRAEYGLLFCLLKEINLDPSLELQLIVTGTHLSPEFGSTYLEIEQNFSIDRKIEILVSSNTAIGTSKSMGLALISFSESYEQLQPDILVVLGDRYEIFSASIAAMIANIPIAHISGGELTLGVIDDVIRHSITKMSHLHFVATEEYKKRVIQLGENENNIFNVGESGLDSIVNLKLLSLLEVEKKLKISFSKHLLLITLHPSTLSKNKACEINNLLEVLSEYKETTLIFTKANADPGGHMINEKISHFVNNNKNAKLYSSLGQLLYFSILSFSDGVVGNSSSGVVEAASFKKGVLNIGDRQKGRIKSFNVIDCSLEIESLKLGLKQLFSSTFQKSLKNVINPYGKGGGSAKIKNILKEVQLSSLLKKGFHDL